MRDMGHPSSWQGEPPESGSHGLFRSLRGIAFRSDADLFRSLLFRLYPFAMNTSAGSLNRALNLRT